MESPFDIACSIRDTERQLGSLQTQLSQAEEAIGAATVSGDAKALERGQKLHIELTSQVKTAQARLMHLNVALDRAIEQELNEQVRSIEEDERSLRREAKDAAHEIGALIAKARYLEQAYCPGFLAWLHKADDLYGSRPNPPEGFVGYVYREAFDAIRGKLDELVGTDGNAESFNARWTSLTDAKGIKKDPGLLKLRAMKTRAVVMRDSKGA